MENRQQHITPYVPVACEWIDLIEIAATKHQPVQIELNHEDSSYTLSGKVRTWYTKNKVEYLQFKNGVFIRMDKILRLNGLSAQDNSCKV